MFIGYSTVSSVVVLWLMLEYFYFSYLILHRAVLVGMCFHEMSFLYMHRAAITMCTNYFTINSS